MNYTGLQFSLQQKFALARTPSPTRETPIRLSLPMNFTHLLVRRASRRSRRSAGFCRFQGKLSVDMTNFERAFGILSFRPKCPAIAGFLFRAVARDCSFWVYIVTNRNSERCLHFGRHDRATQRSNISHLVANEVEAFAGERGSLAVPRKPQLLNVSGQAVRYPILVDYAHSH